MITSRNAKKTAHCRHRLYRRYATDVTLLPAVLMSTFPMIESRQQRRSTSPSGLIVQVECESAEISTLGRSRDFSEGGLSVVTSKAVALQSEVVVRFNLPPYSSGTHIESRGLVVHVQSDGKMGIRFLELNEYQREAIANYVLQV